MAWQHVFDHERRWLITRMTGQITLEEVRRHLQQEREEGYQGWPELIDATGATATFSPEEVRDLVRFVRSFSAGRPPGPTAILATDDYTFGMARMLEALIEGVAPVRVFRSLPEAEAWLAAAQPGRTR